MVVVPLPALSNTCLNLVQKRWVCLRMPHGSTLFSWNPFQVKLLLALFPTTDCHHIENLVPVLVHLLPTKTFFQARAFTSGDTSHRREVILFCFRETFVALVVFYVVYSRPRPQKVKTMYESVSRGAQHKHQGLWRLDHDIAVTFWIKQTEIWCSFVDCCSVADVRRLGFFPQLKSHFCCQRDWRLAFISKPGLPSVIIFQTETTRLIPADSCLLRFEDQCCPEMQAIPISSNREILMAESVIEMASMCGESRCCSSRLFLQMVTELCFIFLDQSPVQQPSKPNTKTNFTEDKTVWSLVWQGQTDCTSETMEQTNFFQQRFLYGWVPLTPWAGLQQWQLSGWTSFVGLYELTQDWRRFCSQNLTRSSTVDCTQKLVEVFCGWEK